MKFRTQEVRRALKLPANAISYQISCWLPEVFPDKALERAEGYLGVEQFAQAGHCKLAPSKLVMPEYELDYSGPERGLTKDSHQILYDVEWQGHKLQILELN